MNISPILMCSPYKKVSFGLPGCNQGSYDHFHWVATSSAGDTTVLCSAELSVLNQSSLPADGGDRVVNISPILRCSPYKKVSFVLSGYNQGNCNHFHWVATSSAGDSTVLCSAELSVLNQSSLPAEVSEW